MNTLLLRLAAPLQAWGDESKYDIRGTRKEPTKSGIIGMIAAAMGLKRGSEEIENIANKLRIGVRVDQPGNVICDFHTARPPKYSSSGFVKYSSVDGTIEMDDSSYVTKRYYLADSVFLVGIECEDNSYLEEIKESLNNPIYPLFLGRRSCPVTLPLCLSINDCALEEAMNNEKWIASEWYKKKHKQVYARLITETQKGCEPWHTQMDQPVSFSPIQRKFTLRSLNKEDYVMLKEPEHDPMSVLEEV